MQHHTKFCKWIHGVFVLFDHAAGTNLRAVCVVFLYYINDDEIKFPIDFRIFYKDTNKMPWQTGKEFVHKTKYESAVDLLEQALKKGFPKCTVLADSWFGISPFVKELKRLKLSYVLEIRESCIVKQDCKEPKLTPTGRLAKEQYDKIKLPKFFEAVLPVTLCGFAADEQTEKKEKVLYHTKIATARLNAVPGKHRIAESTEPTRQTVKYLITNELTWEASKIISVYSFRWAIEEFFRNAKQLSDMEGAAVRSGQGVTLALCPVS